MRPQRGASIALVIFIAALVNFPLVHSAYLHWQVERSGVEVLAEVTEVREVGDRFLVQFTVPADGARPAFEGAVAQVDQRTYYDARDTEFLNARVLPDNGGTFIVDGEIRGRLGLIITLIADLFLLAVIALRVRFGDTFGDAVPSDLEE